MTCPMCAETIPDRSTACPVCGSALAAPPVDPKAPTRAKLIREISIFLIGVGILVALGGAAAIVYGNPERLFLPGVLLAVGGVAALACGIGLAASGIDAFAYAGAGVVVVFFLGLFGLSIASGRGFHFGLLILGAIPLVIVLRVSLLRDTP